MPYRRARTVFIAALIGARPAAAATALLIIVQRV